MMSTNPEVPANVNKWLFRRRELSMSTTGRISIDRSATKHRLFIKQALSSDSGEYSCLVDINGTKVKASAPLKVYCPIQTETMPVTQAVLGENATITCGGTCYDYIYWRRNGAMLNRGDKYMISRQNGSFLHINNVSRTDNGTYSCIYFTGSGKLKNAIQQVELSVLIPTNRVTIATSTFTKSQVGHYIEIVCQANGFPLPESVTWYNNSHVINPSDKVTTTYNTSTGIAILRLTSLTRFDSTVIQCTFRQKLLGKLYTFSNSSQLRVTGKPDAPSDVHLHLSLKVDNLLKVRLKWKPPLYHGGLRMLAYRILYWDRRLCGLNWQDCKSINEHWILAERQAYLMYMKLPHAEMCFAVQSVNGEGLSAASMIKCTFNMDEDVQPTPTSSNSITPSDISIDVTSEFPSLAPTHRPVSQNFQFAFRNIKELCSHLFTVNKVTMKSALVRYFTLFGRMPVAFTDIRNESLAVLGGLVYYQGTLVHAQADVILKTVSEYVENGNGKQRLFVSDNYLEFLSSCPVAMNGQHSSCTFNANDAATLNCSLLKDESLPICSESVMSSQLNLYLFIACGVVVFLLSTCLLISCCYIQLLRKKLSKVDLHPVDDAKQNVTKQLTTFKQTDVQTVLNPLNSVSSKRQDSLDSAIGEVNRVSSSLTSSSSSPPLSDSVVAGDVFHGDQMDNAIQKDVVC
ncbi:uncharacterized protein LOC134177082 isoform X2 [Corticium candelabrum]|nr:uncharacterized protein LOC134177082 isoform X2 [Corticium candelabrum]